MRKAKKKKTAPRYKLGDIWVSERVFRAAQMRAESSFQRGFEDGKKERRSAVVRLEPIIIALERSMESLARIGLAYAKALENEK